MRLHIFVPAGTGHLIDVPLHRIIDANKRQDLEYQEMEAEDLARGAVSKAKRTARTPGQPPGDAPPDPDWP